MKKLFYSVVFMSVLFFASCSDDDTVTNPNPQPSNEVVSGNITENTTWTNDRIWELDGKVYVTEGVTLTINPGTIIKGQQSTGSNASALIVAQDATLIADGSPSEPIIFTSSADNIEVGQTSGTNLDVNDRGLWGGVLVLGNAPGSFSGDAESVQIEGLPATEPGDYGGSNASDSSGILRHVSIRHGGAIIGSDNEINGLTLGGVGNGTIVDHIEVIANVDDGIEFFGGTVDASNLLVWGVGDDAIDIDQAYSGTITNVVTIQENISDHALEIDGPEGSFEDSFTINNLTMFGDNSEVIDGVSGNREYADFRDNAQGSVNNVYAVGFASGADVELDDQATSDNYAAGNLSFTNWEIVFPQGAGFFTTFKDTADSPSTFADDSSDWTDGIVAGEETTGANLDVFAWTMANSEGAIDAGEVEAGTQTVSGNITEDTTWTNDRFWLMEGKVYVEDGVTLTIEPGTIVKGAQSTGSNASALIVAQGGTLIADGQDPSTPIIFTSEADNIALGETAGTNLDVDDRGLWGGVLVLGKAKGSFSGDAVSVQIEGLPATEPGTYGGNDDNDNSGVLRYISIRHGGAVIGSDNEINGLTLGGVGNGTTIDHIEVVANVDDGIEFFGGSVDASNLIVWGVGDDAIDIDQAYSGTITNAITIQENVSDHGLEIDGPEGSFEAAFTINNLTMYGDNSATVDGVSGNREYADFRDNAQGSVNNVYTVGFLSGADLELDDQATSDNYVASELVFSNWEMVLPSGVNDVTAIWKDTAETPSSFTTDASSWASSVTEGSQATGADASVFSWTMSSLQSAF
ncbi:hypothetical protein [Psychroflexus sp. ALD_RP9]|uniref:hypothetical protein n=1 Tax=Psychroflexus sp. ALD_RP9 TaxID=2777186 RepID=UPI001A903FA2|nr:hypothetical protein [Psychroflexus sp. ALD_RP9]QSS96186.1 hypothetical protein IMZ30_06890 [Psychroflexus sp. ALD_RP9]